MKKIFILSILIMPVMANAEDINVAIVAPENAVYTEYGLHSIASTESGDTTHVVTASYVKEAYNDLIAITNSLTTNLDELTNDTDGSIEELNNTISSKRINAVTTWGNDNATQLQLSNAN